MPRILRANISIPLPPGEFDAAALMTTMRPHWMTLLDALLQLSIDYDCELLTEEVAAPKRQHRRVNPLPVPPSPSPSPTLMPASVESIIDPAEAA